ncbi:hypothetical protein [Fibrella arboris]|uniref:hypothetical protein n=1 Tax=Fibrella arboris TaxID=3242486 RepID=UPI00352290E2
MPTLLIYNPDSPTSLESTSFAGSPVQQVGLPVEWPICRSCNSEMQYQGKLKTDLGLELLFICNSDPGMCDEWDANGGGNKVIIVGSDHLEPFHPVSGLSALRETPEYGVSMVEVIADDYFEAKISFAENTEEVLGQLYGEPSWLQWDETPTCDECQKPMRFVAQLEEGPSYIDHMNFGAGGFGYLFDCVKDRRAKFVWQC